MLAVSASAYSKVQQKFRHCLRVEILLVDNHLVDVTNSTFFLVDMCACRHLLCRHSAHRHFAVDNYFVDVFLSKFRQRNVEQLDDTKTSFDVATKNLLFQWFPFAPLIINGFLDIRIFRCLLFRDFPCRDFTIRNSDSNSPFLSTFQKM